MTVSPLLGPIVAMVAWSLLIQAWMYVTRLPALHRAGIDWKRLTGTRGAQFDGVLPDRVQWKAHNYNHLMEQPTIFYAITFVLIFMRAAAPINACLAWAYVAFRVGHSLEQAMVNRVPARFLLFVGGSLCLVAQTALAALRLILGH